MKQNKLKSRLRFIAAGNKTTMKTVDKTTGLESKARESIEVPSPSENDVSSQALNMAHETRRRGNPPAKPAPAADDKEAKSARKSAIQPMVEKSQPAVLTQKPDAASDENIPTVPPSDVGQWVIRITNQVEKSARGIVELGQLFMKAKAALKHGKWHELFQPGNLRFSQRTADKLIQVAKNTALANPPNSASLPPSLDALVLLAPLDANVIQTSIDENIILPKMTIAEAKKFVRDTLEPESANNQKLFDCDATIKSIIAKVTQALKEVPANQRDKFIDTLVAEFNKVIA